jgi:hypothetical protein
LRRGRRVGQERPDRGGEPDVVATASILLMAAMIASARDDRPGGFASLAGAARRRRYSRPMSATEAPTIVTDPDGDALMLHHRYAPRVPEA